MMMMVSGDDLCMVTGPKECSRQHAGRLVTDSPREVYRRSSPLLRPLVTPQNHDGPDYQHLLAHHDIHRQDTKTAPDVAQIDASLVEPKNLESTHV